uniref:Rho guanine nucleotide exchange factor 28 n=1 Tax=Pseudonaja textilis TaxID=8673 RepID=A0A670Y2T6_PSETE
HVKFCRICPVYIGQTIIYGKFDNVLLEEAEFYFVYKGSIQKHVVFAKQVTENTLESIIPAHREEEDVSVFVVMYGKESEFVILGSSCITFKHDIACELACFLVSQANCLTPSSHHTLLSQFDLIERDLQSMDHDVMLAMACEEIPSSWNIVGNSTEDESKCKETLLHLAMRLGLVQLSQFLLFQPGGTVAVTLLNEEGLTPLDLALQNGHISLVEIRQIIHPFEISKVELDENAVLQFAYSSGTLLLTFNHTTDHSLESDVQLFRKYFWDRTFIQKVSAKCNIVKHYFVFNISWYIFRIQEEEWDKYIIPTKSESEKYKVSRTFSFLMNRMASTRNKSKAKNKDAKEKEKANRHHFGSGSYAGVMPCFTCEKPLLGKESLQCSYCNAIVHKSCKDCAPACTKNTLLKFNTVFFDFPDLSFRDTPQPALATLPSTTIPIGVSLMKKEALQQQHSLSRSVPSTTSERKSMSSLEPDTNTSNWRSRSHSEELLQTLGSTSSVDSFIIEDDVDASLWSDLSTDTLEFEAESWSLVVEPWFCNQQEKDVIKRQDVIFELMQTEVHHIHTLFIMSKIFRKGMKEELQLDHSTVDKIFPCLDELLELHQQFFCRMKERRQLSSREGSDRNFVISKIGDVLVQQFSEENARKMKTIYGEFCSHQKEAVSLFKELQQNKKFQNFIKLRNSNLLARRRGIPECILLVTQRITKYPVLVERILQYTKEGTEEHQDLCRALNLIKDMIAAVDLQVSEYEKKQKLLEILSKVENKTYTKLKNGHVFRKQDLIKKQRTLLYEGLVYWKTATGRFKDILALLLNDVMLFLQEKDQKYIFAAVDQKPAVIALQKLIVREVANEERGMFLISASSTGPEMYEIHTSSKEERSHWMRQIQEAVESCPEEEGKIGDSDEDRKITEARAAKIQKCQVLLNNQDQQICNYLEEKLNIYAKLGNMSGFEEVQAEPHLLIKPDSGETPQVASLLAAALKEGKSVFKKFESKHSEFSPKGFIVAPRYF